MIQGTPREANSLSPVPSAARPSRTARRMLFSFMTRSELPSHDTVMIGPMPRSATRPDPRWGSSPRGLCAHTLSKFCLNGIGALGTGLTNSLRSVVIQNDVDRRRKVHTEVSWNVYFAFAFIRYVFA